MKSILFNEFLQIIKPNENPLAIQINEKFLQGGCTVTIKESASGYTVSYLAKTTKKTIANFVCRKAGIKIRITPQKPFNCDQILADLPENMKSDILKANVCKRLSDASLCNPRCVMGYTFTIDGQMYQKCRSLAFLFSVTEENMPYILKFLDKTI